MQPIHFRPVAVLPYEASSQVKSEDSVVDAPQSETFPPGLSIHNGAQGEFGATSIDKANALKRRMMVWNTIMNKKSCLAVSNPMGIAAKLYEAYKR